MCGETEMTDSKRQLLRDLAPYVPAHMQERYDALATRLRVDCCNTEGDYLEIHHCGELRVSEDRQVGSMKLNEHQLEILRNALRGRLALKMGELMVSVFGRQIDISVGTSCVTLSEADQERLAEWLG